MTVDIILLIIHYDYYRDETVALEAFKSGAYDFKQENSSKTGYRY